MNSLLPPGQYNHTHIEAKSFQQIEKSAVRSELYQTIVTHNLDLSIIFLLHLLIIRIFVPNVVM